MSELCRGRQELSGPPGEVCFSGFGGAGRRFTPGFYTILMPPALDSESFASLIGVANGLYVYFLSLRVIRYVNINNNYRSPIPRSRDVYKNVAAV